MMIRMAPVPDLPETADDRFGGGRPSAVPEESGHKTNSVLQRYHIIDAAVIQKTKLLRQPVSEAVSKNYIRNGTLTAANACPVAAQNRMLFEKGLWCKL